MAGALGHRGPDEEGLLVDARAPGLALGMRRLSIIDLVGGHQPLWNESHDVAVVFNGELYNYRDLRERLSLCGHRFATQSDIGDGRRRGAWHRRTATAAAGHRCHDAQG